MSLKDKIINALNCTLEDVSEERLLDLLLDAYSRKKDEIAALAAENAREREDLSAQRDIIQKDWHKMKTDPTYCAAGVYYFICNGRKFQLYIRGSVIQFSEIVGPHNVAGREVPASEFIRG